MFLIMTICALANPDVCRLEQVPTNARTQLVMECTNAMNEWATQHPKWRIADYKCGRRIVEI